MHFFLKIKFKFEIHTRVFVIRKRATEKHLNIFLSDSFIKNEKHFLENKRLPNFYQLFLRTYFFFNYGNYRKFFVKLNNEIRKMSRTKDQTHTRENPDSIYGPGRNLLSLYLIFFYLPLNFLKFIFYSIVSCLRCKHIF